MLSVLLTGQKKKKKKKKKKKEITQKKIKQFYYDNTMVNFCKGCDVHVFFVEEIIEAVSSCYGRTL